MTGNSAPGATPNIAGGTIITTGVYLTNGTPLLAPLGHYGGPTPTMPPMPGSPAIDPVGGDTTSVFATDQRGLPRVVNGILDLGAVAGVYNPAVTLLDPVCLGDGTFQFGFTDLSGPVYTVLASTNAAAPLNTRSNLGPAVEAPPASNQFQFIALQAQNYPQRYYRAQGP